jgi:IS5 family transposase
MHVMTQPKLITKMDARNQVLCAADTELKEIWLEGLRLLDFEPKICERVKEDIDLAAKQEKKARLLDQAWLAEMTRPLPGMEPMTVEELKELDAAELSLGTGRERLLDAEAVFMFMQCRAHLDSVTSKKAVDRLWDSQMLNDYLAARGMRLPTRTCVLGYLNAIRPETREFIFRAQLRMLMADGLVDREMLAIDSFSVSGNTSWPTDSRMLCMLLERAYRLGRKWEELNLPAFTEAYVPEWLRELRQLDFKINCAAGKPHSKDKIKKIYKRALRLCVKVTDRLVKQYDRFSPLWRAAPFVPSRRRQLDVLIDEIDASLRAALRVYQYAGDRVFKGVVLPAAEKILSLSDDCVAYIKKGGREPVIGYKPQIARDGNGFITAFEIQRGNPSDSKRLVPVAEQHIDHMGYATKALTVDDGYSSAANVRELKKLGFEIVSVSGSKGKAITSDEDWESEAYRNARNARSAVESVIFTIRYKFYLYRFSRCGIEAVTAELMEKVIAYNLWRAATLRRQRAELAVLRPAA